MSIPSAGKFDAWYGVRSARKQRVLDERSKVTEEALAYWTPDRCEYEYLSNALNALEFDGCKQGEPDGETYAWICYAEQTARLTAVILELYRRLGEEPTGQLPWITGTE